VEVSCQPCLAGWRIPSASTLRSLEPQYSGLLIAGALFALSYQFDDTFTVKDILVAIVGGAGFDSLGHRISGAIAERARGGTEPTG